MLLQNAYVAPKVVKQVGALQKPEALALVEALDQPRVRPRRHGLELALGLGYQLRGFTFSSKDLSLSTLRYFF